MRDVLNYIKEYLKILVGNAGPDNLIEAQNWKRLRSRTGMKDLYLCKLLQWAYAAQMSKLLRANMVGLLREKNTWYWVMNPWDVL